VKVKFNKEGDNRKKHCKYSFKGESCNSEGLKNTIAEMVINEVFLWALSYAELGDTVL